MCAHIRTPRTYVYIHTYIHTRARAYVRMHVRTHVRTYELLHTRARMHMYIPREIAVYGNVSARFPPGSDLFDCGPPRRPKKGGLGRDDW
eukprot:gene10369-biopygen15326